MHVLYTCEWTCMHTNITYKYVHYIHRDKHHAELEHHCNLSLVCWTRGKRKPLVHDKKFLVQQN